MKIGTKLLFLLTVVFAISTLASATQIVGTPVATNLTGLPGGGGPTDIMFGLGSLTTDANDNVLDLNGFMGIGLNGDLLLLNAEVDFSTFPNASLDIEDLSTGTQYLVANLIATSSNINWNATDIYYAFDPPSLDFGIDLHPLGGNNPTLDFFAIPPAVPEPSSLLLLLSGGAALPCLRRKRRS